jgi:hypothetical protein
VHLLSGRGLSVHIQGDSGGKISVWEVIKSVTVKENFI